MTEPRESRLPRRVAIVGGGASGAILAAHLLGGATRPTDVILVERRERVGLGVAYGTPHPEHLLNVPAGRMSALPEDPGHFARWLAARSGRAASDEEAFAPRWIYGEYLSELLDECETTASAETRLVRVRGEVEDLSLGREGVRIELADGRALESDRVALAFGHLPPRWPFPVPAGSRRLAVDPWAAGALESLPREGDILVVGTALTMVDIALFLAGRGHRGTLHAVSRHGFLPQAHPSRRQPWDYLVHDGRPGGLALRELYRRVREEAAKAEAAGASWADAVDTIRPIVAPLWLGLSPADRRRFLRHVRPSWEIHRHRMAPELARRFDGLRREGFVRIHAARVAAVEERSGGLAVGLHPRGGAESETLEVAAMVNATGPSSDFRRDAPLFVRGMIEKGLARIDPLGLGLDATPEGVLLDAAGKPRPELVAIGPPLRGILWETTAIPDIRQQALKFSLGIIAGLEDLGPR